MPQISDRVQRADIQGIRDSVMRAIGGSSGKGLRDSIRRDLGIETRSQDVGLMQHVFHGTAKGALSIIPDAASFIIDFPADMFGLDSNVGESIRKYFDELLPTNPDFDQTFIGRVPGLIGQGLGFFVPAFGAAKLATLGFKGVSSIAAAGKGVQALGMGAKAQRAATILQKGRVATRIKRAQRNAVIASGVSVSGGAAFEEARLDEDITSMKMLGFTLANAGLGATEAMPLMGMFRRFGGVAQKAGQSVLSKTASAGAKGGELKFLTRAMVNARTKPLYAGLAGVLEEGGQEILQGLGHNVLAKTILDSQIELMDGLGEAGAGGGLVGFLFNAIGLKASRMGRAKRLARTKEFRGDRAKVNDFIAKESEVTPEEYAEVSPNVKDEDLTRVQEQQRLDTTDEGWRLGDVMSQEEFFKGTSTTNHSGLDVLNRTGFATQEEANEWANDRGLEPDDYNVKKQGEYANATYIVQAAIGINARNNLTIGNMIELSGGSGKLDALFEKARSKQSREYLTEPGADELIDIREKQKDAARKIDEDKKKKLQESQVADRRVLTRPKQVDREPALSTAKTGREIHKEYERRIKEAKKHGEKEGLSRKDIKEEVDTLVRERTKLLEGVKHAVKEAKAARASKVRSEMMEDSLEVSRQARLQEAKPSLIRDTGADKLPSGVGPVRDYRSDQPLFDNIDEAIATAANAGLRAEETRIVEVEGRGGERGYQVFGGVQSVQSGTAAERPGRAAPPPRPAPVADEVGGGISTLPIYEKDGVRFFDNAAAAQAWARRYNKFRRRSKDPEMMSRDPSAVKRARAIRNEYQRRIERLSKSARQLAKDAPEETRESADISKAITELRAERDDAVKAVALKGGQLNVLGTPIVVAGDQFAKIQKLERDLESDPKFKAFLGAMMRRSRKEARIIKQAAIQAVNDSLNARIAFREEVYQSQKKLEIEIRRLLDKLASDKSRRFRRMLNVIRDRKERVDARVLRSRYEMEIVLAQQEDPEVRAARFKRDAALEFSRMAQERLGAPKGTVIVAVPKHAKKVNLQEEHDAKITEITETLTDLLVGVEDINERRSLKASANAKISNLARQYFAEEEGIHVEDDTAFKDLPLVGQLIRMEQMKEKITSHKAAMGLLIRQGFSSILLRQREIRSSTGVREIESKVVERVEKFGGDPKKKRVTEVAFESGEVTSVMIARGTKENIDRAKRIARLIPGAIAIVGEKGKVSPSVTEQLKGARKVGRPSKAVSKASAEKLREANERRGKLGQIVQRLMDRELKAQLDVSRGKEEGPRRFKLVTSSTGEKISVLISPPKPTAAGTRGERWSGKGQSPIPSEQQSELFDELLTRLIGITEEAVEERKTKKAADADKYVKGLEVEGVLKKKASRKAKDKKKAEPSETDRSFTPINEETKQLLLQKGVPATDIPEFQYDAMMMAKRQEFALMESMIETMMEQARAAAATGVEGTADIPHDSISAISNFNELSTDSSVQQRLVRIIARHLKVERDTQYKVEIVKQDSLSLLGEKISVPKSAMEDPVQAVRAIAAGLSWFRMQSVEGVTDKKVLQERSLEAADHAVTSLLPDKFKPKAKPKPKTEAKPKAKVKPKAKAAVEKDLKPAKMNLASIEDLDGPNQKITVTIFNKADESIGTVSFIADMVKGKPQPGSWTATGAGEGAFAEVKANLGKLITETKTDKKSKKGKKDAVPAVRRLVTLVGVEKKENPLKRGVVLIENESGKLLGSVIFRVNIKTRKADPSTFKFAGDVLSSEDGKKEIAWVKANLGKLITKTGTIKKVTPTGKATVAAAPGKGKGKKSTFRKAGIRSPGGRVVTIDRGAKLVIVKGRKSGRTKGVRFLNINIVSSKEKILGRITFSLDKGNSIRNFELKVAENVPERDRAALDKSARKGLRIMFPDARIEVTSTTGKTKVETTKVAPKMVKPPKRTGKFDIGKFRKSLWNTGKATGSDGTAYKITGGDSGPNSFSFSIPEKFGGGGVHGTTKNEAIEQLARIADLVGGYGSIEKGREAEAAEEAKRKILDNAWIALNDAADSMESKKNNDLVISPAVDFINAYKFYEPGEFGGLSTESSVKEFLDKVEKRASPMSKKIFQALTGKPKGQQGGSVTLGMNFGNIDEAVVAVKEAIKTGRNIVDAGAGYLRVLGKKIASVVEATKLLVGKFGAAIRRHVPRIWATLGRATTGPFARKPRRSLRFNRSTTGLPTRATERQRGVFFADQPGGAGKRKPHSVDNWKVPQGNPVRVYTNPTVWDIDDELASLERIYRGKTIPESVGFLFREDKDGNVYMFSKLRTQEGDRAMASERIRAVGKKWEVVFNGDKWEGRITSQPKKPTVSPGKSASIEKLLTQWSYRDQGWRLGAVGDVGQLRRRRGESTAAYNQRVFQEQGGRADVPSSKPMPAHVEVGLREREGLDRIEEELTEEERQGVADLLEKGTIGAETADGGKSKGLMDRLVSIGREFTKHGIKGNISWYADTMPDRLRMYIRRGVKEGFNEEELLKYIDMMDNSINESKKSYGKMSSYLNPVLELGGITSPLQFLKLAKDVRPLWKTLSDLETAAVVLPSGGYISVFQQAMESEAPLSLPPLARKLLGLVGKLNEASGVELTDAGLVNAAGNLFRGRESGAVRVRVPTQEQFFLIRRGAGPTFEKLVDSYMEAHNHAVREAPDVILTEGMTKKEEMEALDRVGKGPRKMNRDEVYNILKNLGENLNDPTRPGSTQVNPRSIGPEHLRAFAAVPDVIHDEAGYELKMFEVNPFHYSRLLVEVTAKRVGMIRTYGQTGNVLHHHRRRFNEATGNGPAFDDAIRALSGIPVVRPLFDPGSTVGRYVRAAHEMGGLVRSGLVTASLVPNLGEFAGNIGAFAGYSRMAQFFGIMAKGGTNYQELIRRAYALGALTLDLTDLSYDIVKKRTSKVRLAAEMLRLFNRPVNELQEKTAAVIGLLMTDDMRAGNGTAKEAMTLMTLGFSKEEAGRMIAGKGTDEEYNKAVRQFPTIMVGQPAQAAERSRGYHSRIFTTFFAFQMYPMMKMRSLVRLGTAMKKQLDSDNSIKSKFLVARMMGRYAFGTALSGGITYMLLGLLGGGWEGLRQAWGDLEDDPVSTVASFIGYSMLGGPLSMALRLITERKDYHWSDLTVRGTLPGFMFVEIFELLNETGKYRNMDLPARMHRLTNTFLPGTRIVETGWAVSGLGNYKAKELQADIRAYYRWRSKEGLPKVLPLSGSTKFGTFMRTAASEMRKGKDPSATILRAFKTIDPKTLTFSQPGRIANSLRSRKLLTGLTVLQHISLRKKIGDAAYNRIYVQDAIIDRWAKSLVKKPKKPKVNRDQTLDFNINQIFGER